MTHRRTLLGAVGAGLLAAGLPAPALAMLTAARCGPTRSSTAGPFYVAHAPQTSAINLQRAPGTPMHLSGLVLGGSDGSLPLAGARVELWHADAAGRYHPEGSGTVADYRIEDINLRGQLVTDQDGRFSFISIVPGPYGQRRRHLHWRVAAAGHRTLITQTYWLEDRGSSAARSDSVDRDTEECRWIAFRNENGTASGEVVLVLQAAPSPA